ncbi:Uncharacterized protein BP5553_07927 [Venustampulla echinocandica]|uniref:Phospholipase D n=1 Tax=Venustampulla echinocandica TaxID=2656787 RepID=A0A370THX6_9HELO|nr:Uncharacterized protein BP5553_07927 [Venustampulla echinocandica]RDL34799.1 Uncharacterized protein BP5553_07927 [Venustampulla echinocandica]
MAPLSRVISSFCSVALLVSQSVIVQARPAPTVKHLLAPRDGLANTTSVGPQPFYAIAHRVLTVQGIKDALSHNANAVEIDMTATQEGWWANHDGFEWTKGDTAQAMFETIAEERKAGKTLNFVWLDIKTPDMCDPLDNNQQHCSISGLRDLARQYLEPQGVRVLFGFYKTSPIGYHSILESLNSNEAMNLDGKALAVQQEFESSGPAKRQRVYSYGFDFLPIQFGDCTESRFFTCTELRQGAASGQFGKVFGWTSKQGETSYVDKLLGVAGVDGLIYGYAATNYADTDHTRSASQDVLSWVANHKDRRYLATQNDNPW